MTRVNLGKDTSGRPLIVDDTWLAKLRVAEAKLNFKFTIVQGSWRGSSGAAASADTHNRGGVVDLRSWNLPARISPREAVRELRLAGLISWYRTNAQGFDPHIHTIDYGNPDLDPSAARQVIAWKKGRNGLANNGPDDGARVTIPKTPPKVIGVTPYRIDGGDISHWQDDPLNFSASEKAGLRWLYHKCTEGTTYVDPKYASRIIAIRKVMPAGAYHFAKPGSSGGLAQAQWFLRQAKLRDGDMWAMLDLEDRANLGIGALTDWTGRFIDFIKAETGSPAFIYTPFDLEDDFGCPLWTARYSNTNAAPKVPKPWKRYTIHQFTNGVYGVPNSIPGLGHIDLNTMNGDPAVLTKTFQLGNQEDEVTPEDFKKIQGMIDASVPKIVKAVLAARVDNKSPGAEAKPASGTVAGMLTNIEYSTEVDRKALDAKLDAILAAVQTHSAEPTPGE
jgi:GH25 family lysozyme M1 (1,4-beta-N-acetylmuramidase)